MYFIKYNLSKVSVTDMFSCLSHKPYENVAVKDHILEFKIFFVLVLVNECGLKFTFLSYIELLNFDLLCEIDSVL